MTASNEIIVDRADSRSRPRSQHHSPDARQCDSIGSRLRAARRASGLSQSQLATAVACSQSLVALWEADRREPALGCLVAVAAVLNVTPATLIEDAQVETHRSRWRPRMSEGLDARAVGLIRAWRVEGSLSLYEAGRRARVAPRRLSEIEHGRIPSLREVLVLAKAYGLSVDQLLGQTLTGVRG